MEYVYELRDETNGITGYVGRTYFPQQRLDQHLEDARECLTRRRILGEMRSCPVMGSRETWLGYVLENGYELCMHILETTDDKFHAAQYELDWIRRRLNEGCPLTNTIGGGYDADNMPCPYNERADYSACVPNWDIEL